MLLSLAVTLLSTTIPLANAFSIVVNPHHHCRFSTASAVTKDHQDTAAATLMGETSSQLFSTMPFVGDRYFQLEELEDKETCITEVYLDGPNQTVAVGKTDGPPPKVGSGEWIQKAQTNEDGDDILDFAMTLRRTFPAGTPGTDMGEFAFEVVRYFHGQVSLIGETVTITGTILADNEKNGGQTQDEVGFFNLVETTQERAFVPGNKETGATQQQSS